MNRVCWFAGLLIAFAPVAPSAAQEAPGNGLVRIYLDCSGCDTEFIRTEITFVEYVRDRTAADVHLLIAFQSTGAGGRSYTLNYIGRNRFEGVNDTLAHVTSGDATAETIRQGLTRAIKLGLVRFAADTEMAGRLDVRLLDAPAGTAANAGGNASTRPRDPWNAWVFNIGTSGFMDGESSRKHLSFGLETSANRITDRWKFTLGINANYNESNFEIDDTTAIRSLNRSYRAEIFLVRSLGPNISAGAQTTIATTTFGNQKLVTRLAPAIEYNLFPYAESTRRQFTLSYSLGANSYDYRQVTIFGQTAETLASHALIASYTTRQPWGNSSISINGSQFLHDPGKYRLALFGNVNVRVFRGFSVNLGGNYSSIRDQISLPAEDATPEEILLRQRQIATDYQYWFNFGVRYNFGSLFSPVVNPRMRSIAGEIFF